MDKNEMTLEEDRLKYRAARLAFITAIIGLVSYVVHEGIGYLKYVHKEKELEKRVSRDIQASDSSSVTPFVDAKPRGPDLEVEAGLDLQIVTSENPDGTGSQFAEVKNYPLGKYRLNDAPEAEAVLKILQGGVNEFIGSRFSSSDITVETVGGADGVGVLPDAYYKGDLGTIRSAEYYSYSTRQTRHIDLIPGRTRMTNEGIGFLRAYDMLSHLVLLPSLQHARQRIGVDVTSQIGREYRRVLVKITVANALREEYQELGPLVKGLVLPK